PGSSPDLRAQEMPPGELQALLPIARSFDSVVISSVFAAEGHSSLFACTPIKRQGRILGYIAGLYDAGELVDSVLGDQVPADYRITVSASGRELGTPRKSAALVRDGAQTAPIRLPNATWSVVVTPFADDVSTLRRLIVAFGGVI